MVSCSSSTDLLSLKTFELKDKLSAPFLPTCNGGAGTGEPPVEPASRKSWSGKHSRTPGP